MNVLRIAAAGVESCKRAKRRPRSSMSRNGLFFGLSIILLPMMSLPLASQTPPASQAPVAPQDDDSHFSTTVNEVSLDVVVHDKKRGSVPDLKPEDLAVTDDGIPVKLTGIHLAGRSEGTSGEQLITLVFDACHGPIAKSTQIMADKVLAALPSDGYKIAVLDFKNRLRLMQMFTADRSKVDQAIHVATESKAIVSTSTLSPTLTLMDDQGAEDDRAKASSRAEKDLIAVAQTGVDVSGSHVGVKDRALAQAMVKALNDASSIVQGQLAAVKNENYSTSVDQREHALLTLAGLQALVKSQQGFAGRKALIYFTQNQQLDPNAKKMLKTITEAATQSGILVYTVDMETVAPSTQGDESNALLNAAAPSTGPQKQEDSKPIQGPVPQGQNTGPVWGPQQDIAVMTDFMRSGGEDRSNPFYDTKSPMADFSKATGGEYIDAQANTRKPLEHMVQDLTTYYQVSYVPPFKDYDGKFRTVSVRPLRAGLKLNAKTGYFALPPGAGGGTQPFEAPLLKMLGESPLPGGLKFRSTVIRLGDLPDGNTNTLAVEVPLSELATKVDARTSQPFAHISMVAEIKDDSGTVVEHFAEDVAKLGVQETLARNPSAALSVKRHFFATPGKYTMEVAVQDQAGEKAGAVRKEFEILKPPGAVSLSDMVLVRNMAESHEADEDPLEPLRYEHENVTPNLSGNLAAEAGEVNWFFILHPDAASSQPTVLETQLVHGGKAGKRTTLLKADGLNAATPYLASIKTRTLAEGDYELKAFLSQGGETTEESGFFHVTAAAKGPSADAGPGSLDVEIGSAAGDRTVDAPAPPTNRLAITPAATPVAAPAAENTQQLIAAAREHAIGYNESLPNFVCTEETRRSVDMNGDGKWRLLDTLIESLAFQDRREERATLELNGNPSNKDRESLKGTFSAGEFGGALQAVFRDGSKTAFTWKETDQLNGREVQTYDYRVERGNSSFFVTASNGKQLATGFHGQVFIESDTQRVRRVTLIADLPPDFLTRSTSIGVDYDYIPINGLRYLMPVSAELRLQQGKREAVMNTMEFRDFKRIEPSGNGRDVVR